MKVLVVHDRLEVAESIREIIAELGVRKEAVTLAEDGVGARSALQRELFDLAIVDLTIPHFKGKSEITYRVAEEIFQELFGANTMNVPGDLIGITKDPSALERIDSQIGPHLMAIVEEDQDGNWRQRLRDRVDYVLRASQSRQRSTNQNYDYDVAIITALDKELVPYKDIFELSPLKYFSGAQSFIFKDRSGNIRNGVAYAVGRAGQAPAASATQAIITQFRPALCLMSGFCGGFAAKKIQEGEVLIAESVVDWDFGKWKGKGEDAIFVPRPEPISNRDTRAHQVARELVQSRLKRHDEIVGNVVKQSEGRIQDIKMQLGPLASGSSVVAEPNIIGRIQDLNENIIGVDMEAFAFSYAASRTPVVRPEYLVIKAVADFADRDKADKDHEACCYISAKTVEEIISNRWVF